MHLKNVRTDFKSTHLFRTHACTYNNIRTHVDTSNAHFSYHASIHHPIKRAKQHSKSPLITTKHPILMLVNTSAIVLHSFKYKENQMIVDMLTEQLGRISFIVRVGKKGSAATKRQFFQPLTLLELAFDYRENVGLQKLNDIKIAHPFNSIFFDPFKCSIALFVAEFLYHATKSEAQTALLHNYIEAGLLWLDSCTGSFANFHLVFMIKLTRFIGFYPNTDGFKEGCIFNLRTGCFEDYSPIHTDYLTPTDSIAMYQLLRSNYNTMHLFEMSHEQRNRCTDIILNYYKLHLPTFAELKSLQVLKDIMR